MASMVFISLTLFVLLNHVSAAGWYPPPSDRRLQIQDIIHETCKGSREPVQCDAWLSQFPHMPPNATVSQVIRSALGFASLNLDTCRSMLRDILNSSSGNANRTRAARNCLDSVFYARYRINLTDQAVARGSLKDARAWLSAALAYQTGCFGGLKSVNDSDQVARTLEFFSSTLIVGSSSALGMLFNYDVHGDKVDSWGPPKTERDGFWEAADSGSQDPPRIAVPPELKEDVTVCKDGGGCDYKTVQEAVNAAPNDTGLAGNRFVIRIRAGVYEETIRIPLEKTNVVLLGDGVGRTVITASQNVGQPGVTTYDSATVGVVGDGFMASGITFQNTAGPPTHQAVAFRSSSDRSVVENCEFIGNQDTLYAHSLRQLYKSCRIQGNVDFIFGNAAAIFQDCHILIAPRQQNPESGENNAVTAQGRTDPAQTTGFVFQNCIINGTDTYNALYRANPKVHRSFLGRPWQKYSRTVFIGCTLEGVIAGEGWMQWSGDFALDTLYYGEFNNTGLGSRREKRVLWSSRVPPEHAKFYSVENFIQGDHRWKIDF